MTIKHVTNNVTFVMVHCTDEWKLLSLLKRHISLLWEGSRCKVWIRLENLKALGSNLFVSCVSEACCEHSSVSNV